MKDSQKNRIYNAETDYGNGRFFLSVEEAQLWVDHTVHSKFWTDRSAVEEVEVRYKGLVWCWGMKENRKRGWIKLAYGTLCSTYIIHELTHILAWPRDNQEIHGKKFAATELALVWHLSGAYCAKLLRGYFDNHRVDY